MIEVIKHGKPDGRIRWTAVCSKCGWNVPIGNSMEVRG